jgi:Holliday junction DNA helicase RuvA
MYEYIEGSLIEKNPACCIIEAGGIGYHIQITLTTYGQIPAEGRVRLYLHQVVREDAHLFYGFYTRPERETFRLLLTVSGIGANTARMMLSSLSADDLHQAILSGNVSLLQSIKGIGQKTAQRAIVDLRDKISKEKSSGELFPVKDNRLREEALSALIILGFNKSEADKAIGRILQHQSGLSLEELIKKALKEL